MECREEKRKGHSGVVFSIARNEYLRWICNPRVILFLVMMLFLETYVAEGMIAHSETMGKPFGVFEIFIAVTNSTELCNVVPAVYLLLIGDFPRKDGNTLLYVHRAGRYDWLLGQILTAVFCILTYVGAILLGCALMGAGHCFIGNQWSDVATKYQTLFPYDWETTVSSMITERLYNHFGPYQALGYSVSLLFGFLFFLTMLKLLFFLKGKPTVGVAAGGCLIGFGWIFCVLELKMKWIFPLPHAIEWQHYDEIFRFTTVSLGQSYLYFAIVSLVLIFCSLIVVERYDFG
ncbi:MAG: hypothetical protein NC254_06405 [bacterium]|nr:hypothetical protein [bacterium]